MNAGDEFTGTFPRCDVLRESVIPQPNGKCSHVECWTLAQKSGKLICFRRSPGRIQMPAPSKERLDAVAEDTEAVILWFWWCQSKRHPVMLLHNSKHSGVTPTFMQKAT